MGIKTVGNQTFLSSPANKVSINIAHIVKVYETEYDYYEGTQEQIDAGDGDKVTDKCIAVKQVDNTTTYFAANQGYVTSNNNGWCYSVHKDAALTKEIYELYF